MTCVSMDFVQRLQLYIIVVAAWSQTYTSRPACHVEVSLTLFRVWALDPKP